MRNEYVTQFPFNNESCHIIVQIKQFVNITKDLIIEPRLPARDAEPRHPPSSAIEFCSTFTNSISCFCSSAKLSQQYKCQQTF